MRAGIGLGSNVGDRLANLREARRRIFALPDARPPFLSSAIYETEPVGCDSSAAYSLNAAVELGSGGEPLRLLFALRAIEESLGRAAEHQRNAPRTIDLDLLYFADDVISSTELQIPHPRLHTRRFVLEPLADIRSDLILPNQVKSIAALLRDLPSSPAVVRAESQW